MNKLQQLIKDTYILEQQIKLLNLDLENNRKELQKHFDVLEDKEVVVEIANKDSNKPKTILVAKKAERTYIKYLVEKLKENLNKEIFSEVTEKSCTIIDLVGLMTFLKKNGISYNDFKKYATIKTDVNVNKLKHLYEVGDITKKDLKGCYEAKVVKSIQIKEKEG